MRSVCSRWLLFWCGLGVCLGAADAVKIKLSGAAVFAGQALRITCSVARHPNNRWVEFGIVNFRSSGQSIEGEDSMVTYQYTFTHVPCEAGPAYCAVQTSDGKTQVAQQPFRVLNCEEY